MSYFTPDKTGTNPAYKVPNMKKGVVTDGQRVELFTPVFLDSLELTLEGTVTTPFIRDYDWTIKPEDIDTDAMGRMFGIDRTFTKTLVKSFTVLKAFVSPYILNCSYQQLYPNQISYILQSPNTDRVITPEVIDTLLVDVDNLKMATAPISDVLAEAERKPMLLPPDPNKIYPGNILPAEIWDIDTTNNKKVIFPVAGAFFRDSVKVARGRHTDITNLNADEYFVENVDYIIAGPDPYGIHNTSNLSGVFCFIIFLTGYVGEVTVRYHAYGGSVTQYDVRQIAESLTNVYEYVTNAQILTANSVGGTPIMNEFRARIMALEEEVRKLSQKGQPSYGDVSHGGCLIKKITAVDSEFHWWTIAELYQVAGSQGAAGEVYTADMGHFQLQTLYSRMMIDFMIAVNINKEDPLLVLPQELAVETLSSLVPQGYIPFVDDSKLEQVIRPQLRIIYNRNTIEGSGVFLQVGMKLKRAEETIAVADLSGPESCWRLISSPSGSVTPEDDHLTLPNPDHYWDSLNPDSYQESNLIPLSQGHVVWAGQQALNRPSSGWKNIPLVHFLEPEVDIQKLKTVKLYLEESESNRFIITLDLCGTKSEMTGVNTFTYANKSASVVFKIIRHPVSNVLNMSLAAEIVAGISSNELNLRYVLVNS